MEFEEFMVLFGKWYSGGDLCGGFIGIDGVDGTSGINGIDGTSGVNGVDGTSGINGLNGTNGTSGIDGNNGILRYGTQVIGDPNPDYTPTIGFASVSPWAYMVVGSVVSKGTVTIDNDVTWAVKDKNDSSFILSVADNHSGGQNINFDWAIIGLYTTTTTTTAAPTISISRIGNCGANQISTDYTVTAPPGSTVVLRADFGGSFNASAAGSSASVTIGGFNTQSTSCYYSGTQYFSLAPTYTFTMAGGGSQVISTSANTYEADETNTSLTVVIVSVNGVANGSYASGCRGDSTGGPC